MTTLFSDDFEAGVLTGWDGTSVDAGNSLTVTSGAALVGTRGVDAVMTAQFNASAYKGVSWPASNKLSEQFRFREITAPTAASVALMAYAFDLNNGIFDPWSVRRSATAWTLVLRKRDGSGNLTATLSPAPVTGTACTIEVLYDASGSQPILTVYVDGVQAAQLTDTSVTGTVMHPDRHYMGMSANSGTPTIEAYYDNFQIADAYIGVVPPASFTASPTVVGNGETLAVAVVGTGTTWTSGTPWAVSSGPATLNSHTNTDGTHDSLNLTITGVGAIVLTDGVTTFTINAYAQATSYTLTPPSPASGAPSTPSNNFIVALPANTIILTGATVTPSDGGGGGTFSANPVIAARTVAGSATFTYTPSATTGTRTISTTNNRGLTNPASVTYTVTNAPPGSITDPTLGLADYAIVAGKLVVNTTGPIAKFLFTGTEIAMGVDVSVLVSNGVSAGSYPTVRWSIDGAAWTIYQLLSTDTRKTLASGLTNTAHPIEVQCLQLDANVDVWVTPVEAAVITGFTKIDGTALAATGAHPYIRQNSLIVFGDSITQGISQWSDTFSAHLAAGLDAELTCWGFGGTAWTGAGGFTPTRARFHNPSVATDRQWSQYYAGRSRLASGVAVRAFTYVIVTHGTNDRSGDQAAVQAAVTSYLTAARIAWPSARLVVATPPGRWCLAALQAGFDAYQTATPDGNAKLVDTGLEMSIGLQAGSGATIRSSDSLHPNVAAAAEYAARLVSGIKAAFAPVGAPRLGSKFIGGML